MRQPKVYRTPRDPGYLGGYNWLSLFVGVFLLLLTNVAATQFIAARFRYQPALGTPFAAVKGIKLYQPFRWTMWVWKHGSSPQPSVRQPMLLATLIVVGGSSVTLGLVYGMNIHRTRRLSANTEDIHGSARWANPDDIETTGLMGNDQGVYVGGWYDNRQLRLHYLRHNGPEHILAFAPTRSGKGVGLVIPTLVAWSESCVVYDIKGENWAKTSGYRAKSGHVCFKFSPTEVGNGSRFNPLAELRIGTLRDVSDAQNAAEMLVRTEGDSATERYWQEAAASLTTGMVLHVAYAADAEGRKACLADLAKVFTRPGQPFRDTLNELLNYPHDPEHKHKWLTDDGETTATHPTVREKVQEMLDKEEKDFSGVLSTAKTALSLFSDPLVRQNTAASDFTVDDLVNHDEPVALYLVVPSSDQMRLRPLVRLVFTTIVNRLCERMDFEDGAQKKNKHRLLLMIDEFPSLQKMPLFANALSYMAGYGLKAFLITQDIRQIVEEYGPNESIVSNCHIRVAYTPNQYETAELLSKMTGNKTVQKATFNYSGSRVAPILDHINATVEQVERPLMTPDEIMRLKPPRKEGKGDAERIVEAGDMLIFVSGHFPIYGRQMLYFADPELAERVRAKPPTAFPAIERRKIVEQRPLHKTPNVMSRAETADDEPEPGSALVETATVTAPIGHGFLEQLILDRRSPIGHAANSKERT